MQNSVYWRSKRLAHLARIEEHRAEYFDGIQDIPMYLVLLFYCAMYLIAPYKHDPLKYED